MFAKNITCALDWAMVFESYNVISLQLDSSIVNSFLPNGRGVAGTRRFHEHQERMEKRTFY